MSLLPSLALTFPMINPIAFELGPIVVRWYGLAYMAGLMFGWYYMRLLIQTTSLWHGGKAPLTDENIDDLLLWVTLGIVIGGRLGFVVLYEPAYFIANPSEILAIWHGGMSFHGALVGVSLACWIFAKRNDVQLLSLADLLSAAAPIGIALGRIANFINSEHFGRPTDIAWGMVFPNGGPDVRHPSQLYEAALEGFALFLILHFLIHYRHKLKSPGTVTGIFFIGYGCARIFCELYRVPEAVHALNLGPITTGQIYSLPMIVIGLIFLWLSRDKTNQLA